MSENEIKLDRYAKFRALGQFREYVVKGGDWRRTGEERAAVSVCACVRACVFALCYAKFYALGQFREYVVKDGDWRLDWQRACSGECLCARMLVKMCTCV